MIKKVVNINAFVIILIQLFYNNPLNCYVNDSKQARATT